MTMLSSRTYDEKRDFIRMKVDSQVTLTLENTNENLEGICRDLSGTGMLIEVESEIPEGAVCKTQLASSSAEFPSLDASIKVLRCSQIDESTFHIGTEIVEING